MSSELIHRNLYNTPHSHCFSGINNADDVTISDINTISLLINKPTEDSTMSDKEIKEIKRDLKKVKKEAADKDYSISVLKEIGILTKSGKIAEQYQTLCTPSRQD